MDRIVHNLWKLALSLGLTPGKSPGSLRVSVQSFLLPHSVPWHTTEAAQSNHPLKNIWFVSSLGLFQINLPQTFVNGFCMNIVFLSLG